MFDVQQKQTKQSMQVKFSQFLDKFSKHFTLPEFNFLHDMCLGILKSQSVICLRVASELNEKTTLKKVCERFTKHLNKQDLGRDLESAIITEQCRGFNMETAIIVDDSDNKGVYLFDRGYDKRNLCGLLQQNAMNYIVRSKGVRSLIVNNCEKSFMEVAKSLKLDYTYELKDSDSHFKCGLKRVSIRLNPHPVKHPETIDTWLIVARYITNKKAKDEIAKNVEVEGGYFYLFCDFPGQPDLSKLKIIDKAIRMYKIRWKIE
ncbi:MAG: hypothetical protein PHO32_10120, partial [Candidatus Cloacimonetes bacterium]|nr:hypothetical protein [Candidatus Cloacimonadota bacterium]